MKTTQYVRQEKAIASADRGGIYERWHWGLRIMRDPDASSSEKSLKHGAMEQLITAAAKAGFKLTEDEIQRRLRCARAYKTEAEISRACETFETWRDLYNKGFPAFDVDPDEPLADHRTKSEKARDRARHLAELADPQDALFPLSDFEPVETTLKELDEYATEMAAITARFAARDARRREYLDKLIEAADEDLSFTWADAHRLAYEAGLIESDDPAEGEAL